MGRDRIGITPPGRAALFLLAVCLSALFGCRGGAVAEEPPGASGASEAGLVLGTPPAADIELGRLFARIAGLPGPGADPAAWRDETCWKDFADLAGKAWTDFDGDVLCRMKAWADADLRTARAATSVLFYPFGGPDFVTADALFPGASETFLMGLEPVGNLPDLDGASAEWRQAFFADLGELVSGFLKRGYFITSEMNDVYSRGKVDGALPVIAFFLGRGGCSVVDVRRLAPDGNGAWSESPYERMTARHRRPYGVKIVFRKPGNAAAQAVTYFSCDVENKAFQPDSPLHRLFAGLGRTTTFVKSGSYLLHWDNFSTLRRLILEKSLFVLQDDTSVPFRFFGDRRWEVRLFGRYVTPVKDFTNVEQPDLRQAYEDPASSVSPLPFHFGYRWKSQIDNLLLARRLSRPYKVPVLR
jgi:hypothetical protein